MFVNTYLVLAQQSASTGVINDVNNLAGTVGVIGVVTIALAAVLVLLIIALLIFMTKGLTPLTNLIDNLRKGRDDAENNWKEERDAAAKDRELATNERAQAAKERDSFQVILTAQKEFSERSMKFMDEVETQGKADKRQQEIQNNSKQIGTDLTSKIDDTQKVLTAHIDEKYGDVVKAIQDLKNDLVTNDSLDGKLQPLKEKVDQILKIITEDPNLKDNPEEK